MDYVRFAVKDLVTQKYLRQDEAELTWVNIPMLASLSFFRHNNDVWLKELQHCNSRFFKGAKPVVVRLSFSVVEG